MLATELAQLIYLKKIEGNLSGVTIDFLAQDSRKVHPNTLFFCIDGVTVDGHRFAAAAKEKGAVAVGVGSALGAKVATEGYESVTRIAKEFVTELED